MVSDAVLPLIPAVLEEEDPMPLYALKLLVVLLDTHPTWALHLQRCTKFTGYGPKFKGILHNIKRASLGKSYQSQCCSMQPVWSIIQTHCTKVYKSGWIFRYTLQSELACSLRLASAHVWSVFPRC